MAFLNGKATRTPALLYTPTVKMLWPLPNIQAYTLRKTMADDSRQLQTTPETFT
jgi:hypothetical protein